MKFAPRSTLAAVALVGGATLVLAGCSAAGSTPETPAATAQGTIVTVSETEYSIKLSQATFTPGTYTFDATNNGTVLHNLNIAGPGVSGEHTPSRYHGSLGTLTVTLEKGTYELWCSVDGHKASGMDVTITVG
jgi:uncharacterized cupredoxin-like copper-binding protein